MNRYERVDCTASGVLYWIYCARRNEQISDFAYSIRAYDYRNAKDEPFS